MATDAPVALPDAAARAEQRGAWARVMLGLLIYVAYCTLLVPGVRWAQLRWGWPGVVVPAFDLAVSVAAWVAVIALLLYALRRHLARRREGLPAPAAYSASPDRSDWVRVGMAVLIWLAISTAGSYARSVRLSGLQRTDNMTPTIKRYDTWVANRFTYRHRAPQLGELIAFRNFGSGFSSMDPKSVGRVVGIAGDLLVMEQGKLKRLPGTPMPDTAHIGVWVPQGMVAVMGDNAHPGDYRVQPPWGAMPPASPGGPTALGQAPPPPPPPTPDPPFALVDVKDVRGQVIAVAKPHWDMRSVK